MNQKLVYHKALLTNTEIKERDAPVEKQFHDQIMSLFMNKPNSQISKILNKQAQKIVDRDISGRTRLDQLTNDGDQDKVIGVNNQELNKSSDNFDLMQHSKITKIEVD